MAQTGSQPVHTTGSQRAASSQDVRRYSITAILGQGGFGTVYKGRLEGPEGFKKDVAVKLLSDPNPPDEVLSRFRDEARILGLLRDRNIVNVDPPTRLGGRWAVVMEFVDGCSCERLIKERPLPPGVALEIIEEVARTLDNLWSHPGGDGQPMHLLHRDIKPPNIQVTPNGQVKILDFGIAKADFGARETKTSTHIGGTMGYIAPERLEGEEGPKGDVFSLGVVLHELVTGRRPKANERLNLPANADPYTTAALDLANRMRAPEPDDRPSAREVERQCRDIRGKIPGPDLRDWAKTGVPKTEGMSADELVGQTLTETIRGIPIMPNEIPRELEIPQGKGRGMLLVGLAIAALVVLVAVGGLAMVGIGGGAAFMLTGQEAAEIAPPKPEPLPIAAPVPIAAPAPAPVAVPEPVVEVKPEPKPVPKPVAGPKPVEKPKPAVVAPAPAPEPAPAGDSGTVVVEGDADKVVLKGAGGSFGAGKVPAGSYTVEAAFGGGALGNAGKATVSAGGTVTLKCSSAFKRCQAK